METQDVSSRDFRAVMYDFKAGIPRAESHEIFAAFGRGVVGKTKVYDWLVNPFRRHFRQIKDQVIHLTGCTTAARV